MVTGWVLSWGWGGTNPAPLAVSVPGLLTGYSSTLWIGLNDLDINGGWQWSDNSPLKYLNWESGETGGVTVVMGERGNSLSPLEMAPRQGR